MGMEPVRGIEPPPCPYEGEMLPLTPNRRLTVFGDVVLSGIGGLALTATAHPKQFRGVDFLNSTDFLCCMSSDVFLLDRGLYLPPEHRQQSGDSFLGFRDEKPVHPRVSAASYIDSLPYFENSLGRLSFQDNRPAVALHPSLYRFDCLLRDE